ncbi:hypothetical protein Ancab_032229 [Ancistrocladus abbreviatus]
MWMELVGAAAVNQLSGDLMIEILTRLPVKYLLRFKSVCKTWPPYLDPISAHLHPSFDAFGYFSIVGSITGLICLNLCTVATITVLWNPTTRKPASILKPKV